MGPPPSGSNNGNMMTVLNLSNSNMARLKPAKIFKNSVEPPPQPSQANPIRQTPPPPRHITGICFDDKGETVITAGEDETFRTYNCKTGKHVKTLYSKKYGVDLPRFTHKSTAIVYASTKEDDTIRYHSLHDNKYLQYFRGHKGRVISLEVSPIDDGFMSGSLDKTVRLWDLRSPTCRGLLSLPQPGPLVAYDLSGVVFAVGINRYSKILLYDHANFDKAPFLTISLQDPTLAKKCFPPRPIFMTSLSFSSNGNYILAGCSGDAHYIIDSFKGHVLARLEGHKGLERRSENIAPSIEPSRGISGEEVSWTPDSKYIVSGSRDGQIYIWDVQNIPPRQGEVDLNRAPEVMMPMARLENQHSGPSRCVRFNPRFGMMATAGAELAFWLPDMTGDSEEIAKDLLKKKTP